VSLADNDDLCLDELTISGKLLPFTLLTQLNAKIRFWKMVIDISGF